MTVLYFVRHTNRGKKRETRDKNSCLSFLLLGIFILSTLSSEILNELRFLGSAKRDVFPLISKFSKPQKSRCALKLLKADFLRSAGWRSLGKQSMYYAWIHIWIRPRLAAVLLFVSRVVDDEDVHTFFRGKSFKKACYDLCRQHRRKIEPVDARRIEKSVKRIFGA